QSPTAISGRSVLFPEPLVPRIATTFPRGMSRSSPFRMGRPGYENRSPRVSMTWGEAVSTRRLSHRGPSIPGAHAARFERALRVLRDGRPEVFAGVFLGQPLRAVGVLRS